MRHYAALRAGLALRLAAEGIAAGARAERLAQILLNRAIFLLFCEDAGLDAEPLRPLLGQAAARPGGGAIGARLRGQGAPSWPFLPDASLDAIDLPNRVFGEGADSLPGMAARFTFGHGQPGAIDVATVARAFERTQRARRGGVFYTPEPIAAALVDETVGLRLSELRRDFGLADTARDPARLDAYAQRLRHFTVLDPACGGGALLARALLRLTGERRWIAAQRRDAAPGDPVADTLRDNLYGVDIDPDSVEMTRLTLAVYAIGLGHLPGDGRWNLHCGDSLTGPAFARFPEVANRGGFDCVLINPPYVKLQRLREESPGLAEALVKARRDDGSPLYRSTQKGGFDLYLPFIERGLSMLREHGRMGLIAPSLWRTNAYGAALRRLVHEARALDRWVDFGGHQAFKGALTYTALQLFTRAPNEALRFALRPDGALDAPTWEAIPYASLRPDQPWRLLPQRERAMVERLQRDCPRLDDPSVTTCIFQGLITGADPVYHLRRRSDGRYQAAGAPEPLALEEAILRPLVSGPDARRYGSPDPTLWLLFPYCVASKPRLWTPDEMAERFPKAWAWLRRHEGALRGRDGGALNDDAWYRFSRTQNLDRQALPKLGVAETAPGLRVFADPEGRLYLNNVRVNGILTADADALWFVLGALNGPVANFVFRRTARPHEGGYFAANKQFIAPLPMPNATPAQRAAVGERARALHEHHRASSDAASALEERLNDLLFALYGLSAEERALVQGDRD